MAIPDYQSLMLPVLKHAAAGETRSSEVADKIAAEFGLTAEERDQLLASGRQSVLVNRVSWAKVYLSRAGLLDSSRRGWFKASEAGLGLLQNPPDRIDVKFLLAKYPTFEEYFRAYKDRYRLGPNGRANFQGESEASALPAVLAISPEEQIEEIYLASQIALRADLLDRILQNSPSFFETLIIDLLVAMGYGGSHRAAAQQLGRTGDGGVDGVIDEDRLGLDRVYVQAKRYARGNSVGRPEVQGFVGSLVGLGATKGVFVTTSLFSQHATDYVRHLAQRIILIDGERLADLMIEHNVGVRLTRAVEFKRLDEDFFSEDE
jgi:restriction system protein